MSLVLSIDTTELAAYAEHLEGFEKAVILEQRAALEASLAILEQAITVRTPVNFGTARQGWDHQISGTPARLIGEEYNPVEYALPLETGRKAGKMPPTNAIGLWVRRKLGLTGNEARNAAFLIARAIGRRGTKGAFMLRDGWKEAVPLIVRLHEAIPAKAASRI